MAYKRLIPDFSAPQARIHEVSSDLPNDLPKKPSIADAARP
jgi:hypothetical protein